MASTSTHGQSLPPADLAQLVTTHGSSTVYPSDDNLVAALHARFRADEPYARVGNSTFVVVNPLKPLANTNDESARLYEDKCYRDTSLSVGPALPPHPYELAARMYLLMRRRGESQSVVFRGVSASGKSHTASLLLSQILRLSTSPTSKKDARISAQVTALQTVLDAFGSAKTFASPNGSRNGRLTELHFDRRSRISGAQVLTWGLDKSRLVRLRPEERTYHIVYQMIMGLSGPERERLGIDELDVTDYALLASSGCYRLPGGSSLSDDAAGWGDTKAAMDRLGFKPKTQHNILCIIVAVLLLGNIVFTDPPALGEPARVANLPVLERVAQILGVGPEELSNGLTTRVGYVRRDALAVHLDAAGAREHADRLAADLYAILFAYVVEAGNRRVSPGEDAEKKVTQIVLVDGPGYQTRTPSGGSGGAGGGSHLSIAGMGMPLVSQHGSNGFEEYAINFADELIQAYTTRRIFDDNAPGIGAPGEMSQDGVNLPEVVTMDNSACAELLRGPPNSTKAAGVTGAISRASNAWRVGKGPASGKTGQEAAEDEGIALVQDLVAQFGPHASFVSSPTLAASSQAPGSRQSMLSLSGASTFAGFGAGGADARAMFGINHWAGSVTYDARGFSMKDADTLDPGLVTLLRASGEPFVAKLFSGPGLAAETHSRDKGTLVQCQVASRPLRMPTPILSPEGQPPSPDESYAELDPSKVFSVSTQLSTSVTELLHTLDRTRLWTVLCIKPNESGVGSSFDRRRVKSQVRALLLPDIVKRHRPGTDWSVHMGLADFSDRYGRTPSEYGWREGSEYIVGNSAVWMTYDAWKSVEDAIRALEKDAKADAASMYEEDDGASGFDGHSRTASSAFVPAIMKNPFASQSSVGHGAYGAGGEEVRSPGLHDGSSWRQPSEFAHGEYDSKEKIRDDDDDDKMPVQIKEVQNTVEEVPSSSARRWWVRFTWLCTWWIPSFTLKHIGRMKRPDIQMAWREKVAICMIIFSFCGIVLFFIIFFGRVLCPNFDKGWSINEVGTHTGDEDFWVAVQGEVYDLTNFWRSAHSNNPALPVNAAQMKELVGQDLTQYFPIPLSLSCPGLVTDVSVSLEYANFTAAVPNAIHISGVDTGTASDLSDINWYTNRFLPKMKNFKKGPLLVTRADVKKSSLSDDSSVDTGKKWAIYEGGIYDLSDYFYTVDRHTGDKRYAFLDSRITDLWKEQPGSDLTKALQQTLQQNDITGDLWRQQFACLRNNFYVAEVDFRKTARCQVVNYMLIVAAAIIMSTILVKFLAALQLGGKRNPELQDKFVICQVPCYTEGEESLRRTIDSLAALKYDDKRKLIFLICDGNIIGSGNDRPTPRIVLDILGVDPKLDPEPLLFRSIGEGSKQLNYGKVYSGLYEFEGHVVPYVVVVKVGKPSERSRPGNRGKRDSQILLMHYLNRVHFDAPMSPLELEIYHQMRNVIGIDPAFYEYIFMVDADTLVTPDSLNRLVAVTSDDAQVIAVCGETRLYNEEGSWWTMIQVYEYYISHHMAKAFESLFGSVTCLPGCFSMYRIRTADKGRPLIISNRVIDEYSECIVDTLHKKNLLSLGEDRYLTTIMMKHFPTFKMKFTPDATCHTVAPDRWSVLLSQRRRWINSTIHNLVELVFLPELCGFCCFSMRFIVFVDLLGTVILPATAVYLVWLIVTVATTNAPIPWISIGMIAGVYALQAIIFILKREFMLVGWLIIYIIAYPVYSFFLPIYSFWCMDDFSWGNTRVVVGEGNNKKVVIADDEKFDESMIPLKKFSEYEAEAWETGSHHSENSRHTGQSGNSGDALTTQDPYRAKGRSPSRGPSRMSFNPASQSGDYYRDTNMVTTGSTRGGAMTAAQRNTMMGASPLNTNVGYYGSRPGSAAGHNPHSAGGLLGMNLPGGSATSLHMPFMSPFGGPPSAHGSDFGTGAPQSAFMSPMAVAPYMATPSVPSVYGMPAASMNPFGARPLSTFSLATTVNPFGGAAGGGGAVTPSMNPSPSDDELVTALRSYLGTQDLMSVTKKSTREALSQRFPKADLAARKDFINESIDRILSEA